MRPLSERERPSDWQWASSGRLPRLLWFCLSRLAKVIDDHYIRFRSTRHAKEEHRPVRRYSETSGEILDGCDLLAFAGGEVMKSNRPAPAGLDSKFRFARVSMKRG